MAVALVPPSPNTTVASPPPAGGVTSSSEQLDTVNSVTDNSRTIVNSFLIFFFLVLIMRSCNSYTKGTLATGADTTPESGIKVVFHGINTANFIIIIVYLKAKKKGSRNAPHE
jgi:hypothetical protein